VHAYIDHGTILLQYREGFFIPTRVIIIIQSYQVLDLPHWSTAPIWYSMTRPYPRSPRRPHPPIFIPHFPLSLLLFVPLPHGSSPTYIDRERKPGMRRSYMTWFDSSCTRLTPSGGIRYRGRSGSITFLGMCIRD
jgi:hypothetical protein